MARKRSLFQRAIATFLRVARSRKLIGSLMLGVLVAVLVVTPVWSQVAQIEEAERFYRNGQFARAIPLLEEAVMIFQRQGDDVSRRKSAIALTNLGNARRAVGQPEKAVDDLERAIAVYRQLGDEMGVKRGQIYRARALQDLGLFLQACSALTQSLQLDAAICQEQGGINSPNFTTNRSPSSPRSPRSPSSPRSPISPIPPSSPNPIETEGWRSLGEVLRVLGKLEESRGILERLAEISPKNGAILLSLGNTLRAQGNLERDRSALPRYDYQPWRCGERKPEESGMNANQAISFYEQALAQYREAATSADSSIQTQAQLNRLGLLLEMAEKEEKKVEEARSLLSQIDLSPFPASRQKVYAEINLAKRRACLMQFEQRSPGVKADWEGVTNSMNEAIGEARALPQQDKRAESYGLGELGGLYEYLGSQNPNKARATSGVPSQSRQRIEKARQLTEKALYLAQPGEAPEIAYQWQWQLGRILADRGEREEAIAAYQGAVNTLTVAREDLLKLKTDVQYSFRDRIEPMYRQYLDLLLQPGASDDNLETAAAMVEQLQLAELENFLRCRLANLDPIDEVENPPTAIIYPILLKNRLEVLVKIPALQLIRHYRQPILPKDVEAALFDLSGGLEDKKSNMEISILPPARQLYDWLIRPIEDLPSEGTLMFVLEGPFQKVPMTVLRDRDRYLVEQYSIATSLGSLLPDPKILEPGQWQALIVGISQRAESFKAEGLPDLFHVAEEVKNIAAIVPHQRLENEAFTRAALQEKVQKNPFSVVHISTHGEFNSKPEQTVIYAWDDKIEVDELGALLHNKIDPIELLVLSACQTAAGDRRAPLGIAGVALRANAKSTVASLWPVLDGTTAELMEQFYKQLNQPNTAKAEALRQAQLDLIQSKDRQHPYYWSAFILAGNWL